MHACTHAHAAQMHTFEEAQLELVLGLVHGVEQQPGQAVQHVVQVFQAEAQLAPQRHARLHGSGRPGVWAHWGGSWAGGGR